MPNVTFYSFCLQILHCNSGTKEIHWFSLTSRQGVKEEVLVELY